MMKKTVKKCFTFPELDVVWEKTNNEAKRNRVICRRCKAPASTYTGTGTQASYSYCKGHISQKTGQKYIYTCPQGHRLKKLRWTCHLRMSFIAYMQSVVDRDIAEATSACTRTIYAQDNVL